MTIARSRSSAPLRGLKDGALSLRALPRPRPRFPSTPPPIFPQADRSSRQKLLPCCTLGLSVRRVLNERPLWRSAAREREGERARDDSRARTGQLVLTPRVVGRAISPPAADWTGCCWLDQRCRFESCEPEKSSSESEDWRVSVCCTGSTIFCSALSGLVWSGLVWSGLSVPAFRFIVGGCDRFAAARRRVGKPREPKGKGAGRTSEVIPGNGTQGQEPTMLIHDNPVAEDRLGGVIWSG